MKLYCIVTAKQRDVRLRVKGFPDCGLLDTHDPRVEVVAAYLPEKKMAKWYAGLTCFLSLSRSEGWGLMPHQAMAVGRPAIAVRFGGLTEFFSENVGYCAKYRLAPARYNYAGGGVWAEPDREHLIELMRRVYRDREDARELGRQASKVARQYTWQRSNHALAEVLYEVGLTKVKQF